MTYENRTAAAQEHTLVCLSASPSNAKIIQTAARMASAFGGSFTALYVQTPAFEKMEEADRNRLEQNIRLAKQLGADTTTIFGEDVSQQIAEFARISGVTKIVIGRSNTGRRHFWAKPTLTEKLIEIAPNLDIHIIPDGTVRAPYRAPASNVLKSLIPHPRDLLITLLLLIAATLVGLSFYSFGFTESNIITVYILCVLLTSLFTKGYACSTISAVMGVVLFNYFHTEPRFTLHAYGAGYPVTFGVMLIASIITGTLASKLKDHAKISAQAAYRTKVLFDTNQLLQKARDDSDILHITASQLVKLLDRDVVVYPEQHGELAQGYLFPASDQQPELFTPRETEAAAWVYRNGHRGGAATRMFSDAKCLYLAIRINSKVYGVVGIHLQGKPLDDFENSVLLSILGECALAIDNSRNAKEKELAAVLAKNEQLRANLLRAISHDLRTPLTSICGNASNLLSNYELLDEAARRSIFADIFDDSQWLISLVENLLSITRLEEGRMQFNMSPQLMDEVITEAMNHISRKREEHVIRVVCDDELLLARMDARLIMQVIINLVDNAIKYTPAGSEIILSAGKAEGFVTVSVADNGPGIPDAEKAHVFEMFYTGRHQVADSRRSLGLGLALCKSIINAHGGEITLSDNCPHGCIFTFTIPSGEVNINE